jgi:hypothetical protein
VLERSKLIYVNQSVISVGVTVGDAVELGFTVAVGVGVLVGVVVLLRVAVFVAVGVGELTGDIFGAFWMIGRKARISLWAATFGDKFIAEKMQSSPRNKIINLRTIEFFC